jgi:hypothetical protein
VEVLTGTSVALSVGRNLDGAVKPGGSVDLGRVPAAISGIWASTKAAADTASKDGADYRLKCSGKASSRCAGLAQTFTNDMDALGLDFTGWQTYK